MERNAFRAFRDRSLVGGSNESRISTTSLGAKIVDRRRRRNIYRETLNGVSCIVRRGNAYANRGSESISLRKYFPVVEFRECRVGIATLRVAQSVSQNLLVLAPLGASFYAAYCAT